MPPDQAEIAALQKLIDDANAALNSGDQARLNAALAKLRKFARENNDDDLRARANEAHDDINNGNMAKGLDELAAAARLLNDAGHVLDAATAIAVKGKKNLLFPKLASSAKDMLDKVVQLQKDVEAIKSLAGGVHGLAEIPAALDDLKVSLEKLKKDAEAKRN